MITNLCMDLYYLRICYASLTLIRLPVSMFCLASSISFFFISKTTWNKSLMATTTWPAAFSVLIPKNLCPFSGLPYT